MPSANRPPQEREIRRAADRYTAAVLAGDAFEAGLVVVEALHMGWPVSAVYSDVLAAALRRIGEAWHAGNVSVAHEHRATELTLDQMERVRRSSPRGRPNGRTAVVAAVEGERHTLAARMAADLLYLNGWDVDFLGADTPSPDIARICEERAAEIVVLSATVPESVIGLESAVDVLDRVSPRPRLIVGGEAGVAAVRTGSISADVLIAESVESVPRLARSLQAAGPVRLDDLLVEMGRRIQVARSELGWSQQQLADAAGVDRTFLSAIEHGRQNVSLAALKKLGDALGVELSDLVSGRDPSD